MQKRANGCIEWTGTVLADGYGTTKVNHRPVKAHRVAYALYKGAIPDGLFVCHTCDNRRCVNTDHLFLGTLKDNLMDASQKGRLVHGTKHPLAKLDVAAVRAIRKASANGETFASLGRKHGVTYAAIREAVARRTWKHVYP